MKTKIIIGYMIMILGLSLPTYTFTAILYSNIKADLSYEEYIVENKGYDLNSLEHYNDRLSNQVSLVDPFNNSDYKADYKLDNYNFGEIFAYINIPKIAIKRPIRLDASYENLSKGLAHVYGTHLPIGGQGTRSVIGGHRGWYSDVMFLYLNELEQGDIIYINQNSNQLIYKVTGKEVIEAYETEKILALEDKDMLTLLTCHPAYPPSPQRLLVNAERVTLEDNSSQILEETSNPRVEVYNKVIFAITLILYILIFIIVYKLIKFVKK